MLALVVGLVGWTGGSVAQEASPIWQIGAADGRGGEFGLAGGGYARYADDALFLVGQSQPTDLPYVLPGPTDRWAGTRQHAAQVIFGLPKAPSGPARFTLDLTDTHPGDPPRLQVQVNGQEVTQWATPAGSGDEVVEGRAEAGRASHWTVNVPAAALRKGNNLLEIVNASGSWAIFDALRFYADVPIAPVTPGVVANLRPPRQAILRTPQGPRQPIDVELLRLGAPITARVTVGDTSQTLTLRTGRNRAEVGVAPVTRRGEVAISVTAAGETQRYRLPVRPVRPWTVYVIAHSHLDIGYTGRQAEVLALHKRNIDDALAVADANAKNPIDSQFRFNIEGIWILEEYLKTASPEQRERLWSAIRSGTLGVSAGYANLLTGLMHPEEMMESYRRGVALGATQSVQFDTVSQTDVPGITWGESVAMHAAGVRNLVLMPNAGDRTGGIHRAWRDRPFWWQLPNGRDRVLVWQTDPYAVGVPAGWSGDRNRVIRTEHPERRFIDGFLFEKLDRLAMESYPYDILAEPWSVIDNAPVDADIPVAARMWNERYVYPRVIVGTLSEACRAMRERYGRNLPTVSGDYTPYWEDGAGSAAAETALNRGAPDALIAAESVTAARGANRVPSGTFPDAWREILLFSEHTWGDSGSVWSPDTDTVRDQWTVKRAFAVEGSEAAHHRLEAALGLVNGAELGVYNPTSWVRTDVVRLTAAQSAAGDRVVDTAGHDVPAQRLKSGELAVLVRDIGPFASRNLRVVAGESRAEGSASAEGLTLRTDQLTVELDAATGAISRLYDAANHRELAAGPLNAYGYLPGSDLKDLVGPGRPQIEVVDAGPLVATLRATSEAPGARSLTQEVTLVAGLDRVEITNTLDKTAMREKEGAHFGFPFRVPGGEVRVGAAWATIRPNRDQIAGANKNWFTSYDGVDVSNREFGVAWASPDAPLLEVGQISANLLGSVTNPDEWRQTVGPTQTLYSWALNNHWHTNYRADQEGMLVFRYAIQPHGTPRDDARLRFGVGIRQPLRVGSPDTESRPFLTLSDEAVTVTRLKPTADGAGVLIRLFNPTAEGRSVTLGGRKSWSLWFSDLQEGRERAISGPVRVPARSVVTVRAEVSP